MLNLTPHPINFHKVEDFVNLEKTGFGYIADGVLPGTGEIIPVHGLLRIAESIEEIGLVEGIPVSKVIYGEVVVTPEDLDIDGQVLIVSPIALNALKGKGLNAYAPDKVVRLRGDTSKILGCLGLKVV